jgi:hypothetical protein
MDISKAFEHTGAHLTTTNTVKHAKLLVEHDGLSAAILDHALTDGECTNLGLVVHDIAMRADVVWYSPIARTGPQDLKRDLSVSNPITTKDAPQCDQSL